MSELGWNGRCRLMGVMELFLNGVPYVLCPLMAINKGFCSCPDKTTVRLYMF